jgi:predicted transcriptional regulator of viral defense system
MATEQHGYFTAAQARACGYSAPLLSYHTRHGKFLREQHGLYRIRDFPPSPHEEVMAAWLAVGAETSVVSHESALELLGLADVIPVAVHLTVPRSRRGLRPPAGVRLHTTTRPMSATDTTVIAGIRITAPVRTILETAEAGLGPEQVERAVRQALDRGLISRRALSKAAEERGGRVTVIIDRALKGEADR